MRLWFAIVALGCLGGCIRGGAFVCDSNSDCVRGGATGTCESVGYCSFIDPSCDSGRRFGTSSGPYADTCVGDVTRLDAAPDVPPGFFTIGGAVTGLSGTVVLANNGGDTLSITTDGGFQFATGLMTGQAYGVTVQTQPATQTCSVSNGSGTVGSANITDIGVFCLSNVGDGILCSPAGPTLCGIGTELCCFNRDVGTGSCIAVANVASCTMQKMYCNDSADCGGGTSVCCAKYAAGVLSSISCAASETACTSQPGMFTFELWCDPADASPCPAGKQCTGATGFSGYNKCQ